VQHEAAFGLDRPAPHHLDDAGARRQLDEISRRNDVELHQEIGEFYVRGRVIDDNTHRSFGGVCANIDQRSGKPFIKHRRHGDQHLAVQISAPPTLTRCAAWQLHGVKVSRSI